MQNIKYNFKTDYDDYHNYVAIMISTDRQIFNDRSAVRNRMIEQAKKYKELHIIIFSTKIFSSEKISENCTIYSTNSFSRMSYVSSAYKIANKIVKKTNKSVPLLVTCQDPFETSLVGKKVANLRNNSILLLQIHTDLFSPFFAKYSILNRIRLFISKFTLPHADRIRVVSYKMANDLLGRGYGSDKIIVKPIEVDVNHIKTSTPSFALKEKFPQFKKIVLMVCRLEKEKNVGLALNAWKMVIEKKSDAGLVIVGSGRELSNLKKLAYRLKIQDSVIFEGWQTDLVSYYKGSDLFLNTSLYEGYGMVFKEAEAAGCKIVSTDVGIAGEVGAIIVDWDASSVAEKIKENL